MKLRKVKFANHPIFKDLELSFVKEDGSTFDTTIFAGENGVGKTALLNALYALLDMPVHNEQLFKLGCGSYEFELAATELEYFLNEADRPQAYEGLPTGIELSDSMVFIVSANNDNRKDWCHMYFCSSPNKYQIDTSWFNNFNYYSRGIKGIFSDVEINFSSDRISAIKGNTLDYIKNSCEKKIRSHHNFPSEIKQLLVDLFSQDNGAIAQSVRNNPSIPFDELKPNLDLKINRFKSAFERMISHKVMEKSEPNNQEYHIFFKDLRNGQTISLDDLSSGEKQIIYRGAFLLKDQKVLDKPVVFIDEPEISLHPDWQIKILDFYKNILTNQNTRKLEAQLFVVTHSPFILHNLNPSVDNVIILERNNNGDIQQKSSNEFYNYTSPELIRSAFEMPENIFSSQKNIIFVEGKTDKQYIEKTIEAFDLPRERIEVKYIGSDSLNSNTGAGESNLIKALEYLSGNHSCCQQKFCILFDNDKNKGLNSHQTKFQVENKILVRVHEFNESNNRNLRTGIENLITFPNDFDLEKFISKKPIDERDALSTIKSSLDKQGLANEICSLSQNELESVLEKIKDSILPILNELNSTAE